MPSLFSTSSTVAVPTGNWPIWAAVTSVHLVAATSRNQQIATAGIFANFMVSSRHIRGADAKT
jgi:hypothetical protein